MEEFTIFELQSKMSSGELTARRIVESYLERIEQIDQHGPLIRSVIELNPDALAWLRRATKSAGRAKRAGGCTASRF